MSSKISELTAATSASATDILPIVQSSTNKKLTIALLFSLFNNPNNITGTATAVINRLNLCTGTSSNYTVTLPTPASQTDNFICIQGSSESAALTKLVTLATAAGSIIGGPPSIWAGETVIYRSDGTNWIIVWSHLIPHAAILRSGSTTSPSHDTSTKFNLSESVLNVGYIADTSNSRFAPRRAGNYLVSGMINLASLAQNTRLLCEVGVGSTPSAVRILGMSIVGETGTTGYASGSLIVPIASGEFIELWGEWYVSGGSSTKTSTIGNNLVKPSMSVTEILQW